MMDFNSTNYILSVDLKLPVDSLNANGSLSISNTINHITNNFLNTNTESYLFMFLAFFFIIVLWLALYMDDVWIQMILGFSTLATGLYFAFVNVGAFTNVYFKSSIIILYTGLGAFILLYQILENFEMDKFINGWKK